MTKAKGTPNSRADKAAETTRIAMAIIEAEARERAARTSRLRSARQARDLALAK